MNPLHRPCRVAIVCGLFCCAGAWAQSLAELSASGAKVSADPQTGVARFIAYDPQGAAARRLVPNPALQSLPLPAAAEQHLAGHAGYFGLKDAAAELRAIKHEDDRDGSAMTRFQQLHRGVPIIAGEVIVNQTRQRELTSVGGRTSPDLTLDVTPTLTAEEAEKLARQAMAKWYELAAEMFVVSKPELSIYDPRLFAGRNHPPALAWRLDVTTQDARPINEFFVIDALSGQILLHFNQVPHAKDRMTYDAASSSSLPGTLKCTESNPTCAGGSTDAVAAHKYAGITYDYYASNFGRDSIDGAGMPIVSTVNYCPGNGLCPYPNAFWDGRRMVYGSGYATGEDVVGHELTHGVTQYSSGLIYYYQSGAINESLSDVFGELVQQSDPNNTITSPSRKWLIAEDLPIGAVRSLADPTLYQHPDKISSPLYIRSVYDYGGVHYNSGVNNKAAYLMANGGSFNGFTVAGIGNYKTGQIYYKVQTRYLTSGSDYLDLYNYLNQACAVLVGSYGITLSDCTSVSNATLAVEMHLPPPRGSSTDLCPAGQAVTSTLFSDNFESGFSKWQFATTSGFSSWRGSMSYSYSKSNSLYGPDASSSTDFHVRFANPVYVQPNSYLFFNHLYAFDAASFGGPYYDGGVLEYSVDNGNTWTDAAPLYSDGQKYTSGMMASGNPLSGRSGFLGSSGDYVSSRFNLSSLADKSVNFRWRIVTDSVVGSTGWYVDDVSINQCSTTLPNAPSGIAAEPVNSGVSVAYTPDTLGSGTFVSHVVACSDGTNTVTATGTQLPINVPGLVNGRAYTCRAFTRSSVGDGAWSAASNVVVPGTATAPNNVVVRSLPLKAVVSFTAPTSSGGSAVTGYTASCSAAGQATRTATTASSPVTVKSLKGGVTYACKIGANNAFGSGLESAALPIKVRGVDLNAILSVLLND